MNSQRGMTMVELLVSLAIVMVIIGSATTAYLKLLRTYKTHGRLAESYMANMTGLELLRYDIEMAGFGLPQSLGTVASYSEAVSASLASNKYNPLTQNDAPSTVPRAFRHLNDTGLNSSDILTIKSTAASSNTASRKWSTITYSSSSSKYIVKMWGSSLTSLDSTMDFVNNDQVIVLDNNYQLMVDSSLNWVFNFATGYFSNASVTTFPHPTASNNKYVWYVYGLDTNSAHRMPFNRVDYYLDSVAGDAPSSCASNTYTLYRSTVSQDNGGLSKSPLIDCVRNFQVAFGLGTNLDGTVNSWVNTLPSTMSASDILAQVRAVPTQEPLALQVSL